MVAPSIIELAPTWNQTVAIDPIVISADPVVRRTSNQALSVQDGTARNIFIVNTSLPRVSITNLSGLLSGVTGTLLHIAGDGFARFISDVYSDSAIPIWHMRRARGTSASPQGVTSGAVLGQIDFAGLPAGGIFAAGGSIICSATENWTTTARGARFSIPLVQNGTTNYGEVLGLEGDGTLTLQRSAVIQPGSDAAGSVGTAIRRFALVRAVTVTSGDLAFENGWRFTEDWERGGLRLLDSFGSEILSIREDGVFFKGRRLAGTGQESVYIPRLAA